MSADRESSRRAWGVVVASAIGLALGIATTIVSTFGVFSAAIASEFAWSQSEIFAALLVVTLVAAALAPVVGTWIDRYGMRRVILTSFLAEALIFASFYWQTDNLTAFYLRYAALAFLGLGTTHVAFARLITLWFDKRRGLALGIALAGVGIGGFLWPLGVQWVISDWGWREAYLAMALTIVLIALPMLGTLVHEPSADRDGSTDVAITRSPTFGFSLREARGKPVFWRMVVAFFLVGLSIQSLLVHVVPLLRMRAIDAQYAALAQSLMFVAVTTGRLVTGWLMDRIFAPRVAAAFVLVAMLGVLLLAVGQSGPVTLLGALLVGLAVGAEVDVLAYLTGRYFGTLAFGQIYGVYYGVYSLSGGVGPWLTAFSVDLSAGYGLALTAHALILALGAVLLWGMPRFATILQPPGRESGANPR